MENGTVKWFNQRKRFGFIKRENSNQEYIVYQSNVEGTISDGDKVEFEVGESERGPEAIHVKNLSTKPGKTDKPSEKYQEHDLDKEQKDAASYPYDKPLLVSAGPGSGKTTVVVERVKDLILNQNVEPDEILCMTYTKAAAGVMLSRLQEWGGKAGKKITSDQVRTIHSLCYELIELKQNSTFNIKDNNENENDDDDFSWEVKSEWKRLFKVNFDTYKFNRIKAGTDTLMQLVDGVSAFKREDKTVKDLENYLRIHEGKIKDDEYLQRLQDLEKYFNAYNKYLKNLKGLYNKKEGKFVEAESEFKDFEDYLQDAYHKKPGGPYHQYCKTNKEIKHLIIDEFQDNNYLEFEIAKELAPSKNITVVGDINQSIYSFQGANPEIFNNFKEWCEENDGKTPEEIRLKYNYRSTPEIVKLGNTLLKNDPIAKDHSESITNNPPGERIVIREFCKSTDELKFFQQIIMNKIGQKFQRRKKKNPSEIKFGDFAILTRTNKIRIHIHKYLVKKGIPCRQKKFHTLEYSFYQKEMAMKVFGKQLEELNDEEMVEFKDKYCILDKTGKIKKCKFGKYSWELKKMIESKMMYKSNGKDYHLDEKTNLEVLVRIFRVLADPEKKLDEEEQSDGLTTLNYRVLYNLANNYMENNKNAKVKQFQSYITEFTPPGGDPRDNEGDAVEIRTVHSVKGEEYPYVIVSNSYENHFPLRYRERELKVPPDMLQYKIKKCMLCGGEIDENLEKLFCTACPANIEKELHDMEERRLYYVAITRAQNQLFITFPKKDMSDDERGISEFLVDLDYFTDKKNIDYLDVCEAAKMSPEEISKIHSQHEQQWEEDKKQWEEGKKTWKEEYEEAYNKVVNENKRLQEKLKKILSRGGGDWNKAKLEQEIRELKQRISDFENEKNNHDTFDSKKTSWEILELDEGATEVEIKKAWRRLSKFWHPDSIAQLTPERKKYAEKQFIRIDKAYKDLMKK